MIKHSLAALVALCLIQQASATGRYPWYDLPRYANRAATARKDTLENAGYPKALAEIISEFAGPPPADWKLDNQLNRRDSHKWVVLFTENVPLSQLPRRHNRLVIMGEWMSQNPGQRPTAKQLCAHAPGFAIKLNEAIEFLRWAEDFSDTAIIRYATSDPHFLCEQRTDGEEQKMQCERTAWCGQNSDPPHLKFTLREAECLRCGNCDKAVSHHDNSCPNPHCHETFFLNNPSLVTDRTRYRKSSGFWRTCSVDRPYCQACWSQTPENPFHSRKLRRIYHRNRNAGLRAASAPLPAVTNVTANDKDDEENDGHDDDKIYELHAPASA